MKEPMNLKDLPAYVDGLKERGEYGEGVLVDMGRIEVAPRSNKLINLVLALSICLLVGLVTFNMMFQNIIIVAPGVTPQQVSSIVSENGGRIMRIEQNEDNSYKIKVLTFWKNSFLENMRKNKDIKLD
jgi:hypothetical protein